jgi:tetratricopeptide (TPR) repeat protein
MPPEEPPGSPLSLADFLQRAGLAQSVTPLDALGRVTVQVSVLEDLRPMAESLEWELARLYWNRMGVDAFARSEVPFLINNDGQASEDAAATFYAHCRALPRSPARLQIVEYGGGTGLFARYFLDAFAGICEQEGADYYRRLTYYVTDGSPRTVEQWRQRKLFAPHGRHCVLAVADAMQPGSATTLDGERHPLAGLAAIFCNYLLDVLPSAVVRPGADGPEQLLVRTSLLDDAAQVAAYTTHDLGELRRLAASRDPADRQQLLALFPAIEVETRFGRIGEDGFAPHASDGDVAQALAWGEGLERVLYNYGAFWALRRMRDQLQDSGFLLIQDYGPVRREEIPAQAVLQRFGGSAALGVNFPLLGHLWEGWGGTAHAPPGDEEKSIHARFLALGQLPATCAALDNRFSKASADFRSAPREEARKHLLAGRRDEALEKYRRALSIDPRNWTLLGEVAEFVALHVRDFSAGLELAQAALERNPWYSAWLWNVLGDCLYCLERYDAAHEAYLQAERIDPGDARAQLNLAYTLLQRSQYREALDAIARGLHGDTTGAYRQRLLDKQQQILLSLASQRLQEQERAARRGWRFQ